MSPTTNYRITDLNKMQHVINDVLSYNISATGTLNLIGIGNKSLGSFAPGWGSIVEHISNK